MIKYEPKENPEHWNNIIALTSFVTCDYPLIKSDWILPYTKFYQILAKKKNDVCG